MNKSKLIWGIICLIIAVGLAVANLTLPEENLMFQVGDINMPWVPPVVLGIIGIILLATMNQPEEKEDEMKIEGNIDPDKATMNKNFERMAWGAFLIISHEGLQVRIQRQRWFSLAAGVVLFLSLLLIALTQGDLVFGTAAYSLFVAIFSLFSWCFVLAILGFGMRHLTFHTPFLDYANEAVLPFYILHQTVIISVGYFVVRWVIPDWLKFVVIATSSFAIVMTLYEFLVRRFNVMRVLFGMKPLKKQPSAKIEQVVSIRLGVTQLFFSNRQATENAKIFSKTPRILGVFDNFLGDLGSLAVQVRKSFIL